MLRFPVSFFSIEDKVDFPLAYGKCPFNIEQNSTENILRLPQYTSVF